METLLRDIKTYSFMQYDEMMFFIKELENDVSEINIQKQVSVMESGDEIFVWILTVVKDFI